MILKSMITCSKHSLCRLQRGTRNSATSKMELFVTIGKGYILEPQVVTGQLTPEENFPPVRFGVSVKVKGSFRAKCWGSNQTIAPEKNWPLVRVRVCVSVIFGVVGTNFLRGSFPRTILDMVWFLDLSLDYVTMLFIGLVECNNYFILLLQYS